MATQNKPSLTMSIDELTRLISAETSLAPSKVRNTLEGVLSLLAKRLLEGKAVDIAGLGSFRPITSGKTVRHIDELDGSTIHKISATFTPDQKLREALREAGVVLDGEE